MKTHNVPRVTRRRFKRAVRKWRTRRKAWRAIKGLLHHGVLMLLK